MIVDLLMPAQEYIEKAQTFLQRAERVFQTAARNRDLDRPTRNALGEDGATIAHCRQKLRDIQEGHLGG